MSNDLKSLGITKDEYLEAVHYGVKNAIMEIATNATDMPCADFYEAIKEGQREAASMIVKGGQ